MQRLQLVAKRNTRLVRFETGGTNTPVFQPVGFSQSKAKLDALLNSAVSAAFALHDLRRTAASGMASLGVQPHVIEACWNHKSGAIRGVAAIYNRFNYASEKRHALDLWGAHVAGHERRVMGVEDVDGRAASAAACDEGAATPRAARRWSPPRVARAPLRHRSPVFPCHRPRRVSMR